MNIKANSLNSIQWISLKTEGQLYLTEEQKWNLC